MQIQFNCDSHQLLQVKSIKGQISKNMSLSRVVEPIGVKSNYFGEDLELFKNYILQFKHNILYICNASGTLQRTNRLTRSTVV